MKPFILFEGLDRTGKSILSAKVAEKIGAELLQSPPKELLPFREYFDGLSNETNFAYYLECNRTLNKQIRSIRKNTPVVLDRYFFTTVAYHSVKLGRNIDYILDEMTSVPNRIYYFTGNINELNKRAIATGNINPRFHGIKLWKEVDKNYERLFFGNPNVVKIDSTKLKLDEVYKIILDDLPSIL